MRRALKEEEEGGGEEEEEQQFSGGAMESSTPQPTPSLPASGRFAPLPWQGHFDEERDISVPNSKNKFHLYLAGSEGPVVFCLHGGGYSGLSFALAAGLMKNKVRVVAMDFRGHGLSETSNDTDLSIETLHSDVFDVIDTLYGNSPPALILVGHSMGGAVAVHCAAKRRLHTLAALVVLDVVEVVSCALSMNEQSYFALFKAVYLLETNCEMFAYMKGTALASLSYMQSYLSNRPLHFPSVEKAVCDDLFFQCFESLTPFQ